MVFTKRIRNFAQSYILNWMNAIGLIPLISLADLMQIDILFWLLAIPMVVLLVVYLIWQQHHYKALETELTMLNTVKGRTIEYDLVLKAMKLCTWHIDAVERTITYDNDFRERQDCFVPTPGGSIDQVADAMVEADRQHIRQALDEFCEGLKDEYHEISRVRIPHTKNFYWTESYATIASRNPDGTPKFIVGTSMRIDERKSMENALIMARNKAEESDRLKSAFIANMSHEIRTPLNAIIGFTSVLPDVKDEDERRDLINLIQENNQKLLQIIEDVMNISKIESGKEQLVVSSFDLNEVLSSVVETFVPKAQPGVVISTAFDKDSQNVTTDLNRLMEILNHLLLNATKFTSQGNIVLGYKLVEDNRIHIWVKDTGMGIAPENQERVFERFFKVDEYVPGAGLGLSICRTMANSMGGDIGVESVLGKGSKFWLDIPI